MENADDEEVVPARIASAIPHPSAFTPRDRQRAGVLREQCSLVELTGALTPSDSPNKLGPHKAALVYLVETRRIELPTFALRTRRSPI